jgi:hypothetical protein
MSFDKRDGVQLARQEDRSAATRRAGCRERRSGELGWRWRIGSAAAFTLATVLSFAAVVAALTTALAFAIVLPFTGVF